MSCDLDRVSMLRGYHVQRMKSLRWLLWWFVFLTCFNIGLVLVDTWWSLFPAIFCFGVCVFAWVMLKREKEIAHTFDQ